MSKKNTVNKLPDWFKIEKYENTKKFVQKDWYRELSFRLYMQNALTFIQKHSDEFSSVKFQKSVLFCFAELIKNPTDTTVTSKRINDYFQNILKHYRANNEWSPGSTLSLFQSTLSANRISVPEDFDTFTKKNELSLTLQLKKPVDLLSPNGLKTLNKIYDERKAERCSTMHSGLSKSAIKTDLDLISDVLSDSLQEISITSFIKNQLEFKDPEARSEKELQIAGINTTDEILVVDLLHDEKVLISQFKETIRKLKAERDIPNKALKASESKLAKLSAYKVLPYIDLLFWEEFTKTPISESLMDAVLFPRQEYTTDNSSKLATEALSVSFLHSLAKT